MSTNESVQVAKVTFPNQFISMAGNLFTPPDMDRTKKYPASALAAQIAQGVIALGELAKQ
jgi:hypothetical protein